MKYSEEVGQKIIAALTAKGAIKICTLCNVGTGWQLSDSFFYFPVQMDLKNLVIAGRGMPLIALVCKNCGHTVFINLIGLGILKGDLDQAEEIEEVAE